MGTDPSTTAASTVKTTATIARVKAADFSTPARFTPVSTTTAATPTRFARSGQAYPPTVSAIAAQEADLPTTKHQPAR